jgi:hypothetical protein
MREQSLPQQWHQQGKHKQTANQMGQYMWEEEVQLCHKQQRYKQHQPETQQQRGRRLPPLKLHQQLIQR